MLNTVFEYATSTGVLCAASFVAGGLLWPKLKDKVAGVPTGFRTAMDNVEARAKADVQAAISDVFGKLAPAAPVPPPAPVVAAPAPATVAANGAAPAAHQ
jgi:hypothetical protein